PELTSLAVISMTRAATGYSFKARWAALLSPTLAAGTVRITVRTTLEVSCVPDTITRLVHAVTDLYLCGGDFGTEWASSGDRCVVCRIIAEMAPSPIVPDKTADELPLARALRLRIVELARVSNTVVLLAENDGGDGLDYEWQASGGRIERLAPDVVAWTLEE